MNIGIPKEVKTDEFRVGATPSNVLTLVKAGHKVYVEKGSGEGSGFSDTEYKEAGAVIAASAKELYENSTLIVKVKEPQSCEYEFLNESHTLFCYLHLAPVKELSLELMKKRVCAIAYETVSRGNELPLLKPMSEIAGKMAPVVGAHHLNRYQGGEGVLISGAHGVPSANVLILGAGNAGYNVAKIAFGMGAEVIVLNRSTPKLDELKKTLPSVKTELFSKEVLNQALKKADIVISSVLIHGGSGAPKLITKEMLRDMKKGSVIVDIAIDQGGTSEASKPTTHTNPVFTEEGVIHYCVANMPGAYPKSATTALTNATFEYVLKLADMGTTEAIKSDKALALGVNVFNGVMTNSAVAKLQELEFQDIETLIK